MRLSIQRISTSQRAIKSAPSLMRLLAAPFPAALAARASARPIPGPTFPISCVAQKNETAFQRAANVTGMLLKRQIPFRNGEAFGLRQSSGALELAGDQKAPED